MWKKLENGTEFQTFFDKLRHFCYKRNPIQKIPEGKLKKKPMKIVREADHTLEITDNHKLDMKPVSNVIFFQADDSTRKQKTEPTTSPNRSTVKIPAMRKCGSIFETASHIQ